MATTPEMSSAWMKRVRRGHVAGELVTAVPGDFQEVVGNVEFAGLQIPVPDGRPQAIDARPQLVGADHEGLDQGFGLGQG